MRIPNPPRPAIQGQRFAAGHAGLPYNTVQRAILPVAPPGSRISQQPTTTDVWGRMSGLGNDGDRYQVPTRGLGDAAGGLLSSPVVCGVIGYLAIHFLARS